MKYLIKMTQTYSGETLWSNLPEKKKKFRISFYSRFPHKCLFYNGKSQQNKI
jgi:hypothetical protein